MSPSHVNKKGVRYRYYVSTALIQGRKADAGGVARVPAELVEALVLEALRERLHVPDDRHEWRALLQRIVLHVEVGRQALNLSWCAQDGETPVAGSAASSSAADGQGGSDGPHDGERLHVSVPMDLDAQRRRRDIILPDDGRASLQPIRQGEQHNLLRSIVQGKTWLKEITAGATIRAIAAREHRSERMIRMLLTLAFLDPKLVRATLQGALPRGVSTRRLIDAPMDWHAQWRALDLSRPT